MKAAVGVLAASAAFLAGVLTGVAQDKGGGSAPGLVELGDRVPATAPSSTTTPTIATTVPVPTAPPTAPTTPTTPATSPAPPVTVDDDHEEVEHDVGEGDLDDFDDDRGPGGGDEDESGPGGGNSGRGGGGDDD